MSQFGICRHLQVGRPRYDKTATYTNPCDYSMHIRYFNDCNGDKMSDQYELINLQAMTGKLFIEGELAAEYKVEQCDKCAMVTQLDQFGYQKSDPKENIIWFCKGCR